MISQYLAEIGSRGRKHRLGLWLASQRPQDLNPDVSKVIGTHIILGLNSDHQTWLRGALGDKVNTRKALALPNHYALFRNAHLWQGKSHLIRLPRAPNFHQTFV